MNASYLAVEYYGVYRYTGLDITKGKYDICLYYFNDKLNN